MTRFLSPVGWVSCLVSSMLPQQLRTRRPHSLFQGGQSTRDTLLAVPACGKSRLEGWEGQATATFILEGTNAVEEFQQCSAAEQGRLSCMRLLLLAHHSLSSPSSLPLIASTSTSKATHGTGPHSSWQVWSGAMNTRSLSDFQFHAPLSYEVENPASAVICNPGLLLFYFFACILLLFHLPTTFQRPFPLCARATSRTSK